MTLAQWMRQKYLNWRKQKVMYDTGRVIRAGQMYAVDTREFETRFLGNPPSETDERAQARERETNAISDEVMRLARSSRDAEVAALDQIQSMMNSNINESARLALGRLQRELEEQEHRRMHNTPPVSFQPSPSASSQNPNITINGNLTVEAGGSLTVSDPHAEWQVEYADDGGSPMYVNGYSPDRVVIDELVQEDNGIAENGETVMPEGYARSAKKSMETWFSGTVQCPSCDNSFIVGDKDSLLICTVCSHEFERPDRAKSDFVHTDNGHFRHGVVAGHSGLNTTTSPATTTSSYSSFAGTALNSIQNQGQAGMYRNMVVGRNNGRGEAINVPIPRSSEQEYRLPQAEPTAPITPAPSSGPLIPFGQANIPERTPRENDIEPDLQQGLSPEDTGPWRHPLTGATVGGTPQPDPSLQVASVSLHTGDGQQVAKTVFPAIHVRAGDTLNVNYKLDINP